MTRSRRAALLVAATLTSAGLVGTAGSATAAPTPAAETPATVKVLTTGLSGPRELSATSKYLYVAESDSGQVTRVAKAGGARKTQVSGIALAQGVVRTDDRFYVAAGEPDPFKGEGIPTKSAKLLVAKTSHKPKVFADLLKYELTYNPDNQTQLDENGDPLDAIANPYYVIRSRSRGGYLLVANAGGNDIIAVSRSGKMSTFFVPPSVTTGPCGTDEAQNNTDAGPSCDAVPTGMAYGPDGYLYISALTGFAPGEGRVYVVDSFGKLIRTLTGFSGPTGVAVGPDGAVYVSELLQGADLGDAAKATKALATGRLAKAADDPDPTPVGQIVKVPTTGARTYAQVTMPSGLLWNDGQLYASAWSLVPDAGQIVSVDPVSFLPE